MALLVMSSACGPPRLNSARDPVFFVRSGPASSMRLSREQRRALKTLADAPRGVSEEMLVVVHGFSAEIVTGLVLAGLATVVTETKKAPRGLTIMVERIRITDDGKRALEG
jgi:hypothetical protein